MSLLAGRSLRVLDTETTGLQAGPHRLVEVACVPIEDGVVGEGWSTLVHPGMPIPREAAAIHGIDDAAVRDAPRAPEAAAALRPRIGDHPIVFHNAPFDLPFIRLLVEEGRQPLLTGPVIDTLGLSRGLDPAESHALGRVAARLGIRLDGAHRALPDAIATAHVLVALAARWEKERGVRTLAELAAASQDVVRATSRQPAFTG